MACKVIYKRDSDGNLNVNEIDYVKAANGKRSLLFDTINSNMDSSYKALSKYNIIHTKGFKEWYKNGSVDSNGEPESIISDNKILVNNGISSKMLAVLDGPANLSLNNKFKGKLIYAMSGTGKSFSDVSQDFTFYGDSVEDGSQYKEINIWDDFAMNDFYLFEYLKKLHDGYQSFDKKVVEEQKNLNEDYVNFIDSFKKEVIPLDEKIESIDFEDIHLKGIDGEPNVGKLQGIQINGKVKLFLFINPKKRSNESKSPDKYYFELPTSYQLNDIVDFINNNPYLENITLNDHRIDYVARLYTNTINISKSDIDDGLNGIYEIYSMVNNKDSVYGKVNTINEDFYNLSIEALLNKTTPIYKDQLFGLFKSGQYDLFKELYNSLVIKSDPNDIALRYFIDRLFLRGDVIFYNIKNAIQSTESLPESELRNEILEILKNNKISNYDKSEALYNIYEKNKDDYYKKEALDNLYNLANEYNVNDLIDVLDFDKNNNYETFAESLLDDFPNKISTDRINERDARKLKNALLFVKETNLDPFEIYEATHEYIYFFDESVKLFDKINPNGEYLTSEGKLSSDEILTTFTSFIDALESYIPSSYYSNEKYNINDFTEYSGSTIERLDVTSTNEDEAEAGASELLHEVFIKMNNGAEFSFVGVLDEFTNENLAYNFIEFLDIENYIGDNLNELISRKKLVDKYKKLRKSSKKSVAQNLKFNLKRMIYDDREVADLTYNERAELAKNYHKLVLPEFHETLKSQNKIVEDKLHKPIQNTTPNTKSLTKILDSLSNRFGIKYQYVNNPNGKWAGRYKPDGTIEINEAYVHQYPDTPFHEFFHPFLDVIEKQNKKLFANLKTEIDSILSSNDSPEMKMRLKRITNSRKGGKYVDEKGNLTEIGYKEAITELVGAMALQMHDTEWRRRIKEVNPKWEPEAWESKTGPRISEKRMEKNKSLFQKLMDYVRTIIRKVFRDPDNYNDKEGFVSPQDIPVIPSELNPNMTLSDIGYLMGVDTARPVRLDLEASLDQPIQEKAIEDTYQVDIAQFDNESYSNKQRKIIEKYNENIKDLIPGRTTVNVSELKDPIKRKLLGLRGETYESYHKRPGKNGRVFVENRVSMKQDLLFLGRSRKTAEEIRAQEESDSSKLGREYGTLLHAANEDVLNELIEQDVKVDLDKDKYDWAEGQLKAFRETALYNTYVEEIKKGNAPFQYKVNPNGKVINDGVYDYEQLIKSMYRLYYQVYEEQNKINKHLSKKTGEEVNHKPIFMLEKPLYDEAADEAGTTDFMVFFSDGTALIYDHKFIEFGMRKVDEKIAREELKMSLDDIYKMRANQGLSTKRSKKNNWFYGIDPNFDQKLYGRKQESYDMQLSRYSEMLIDLYGVERIRQARIIPTAVSYTSFPKMDEKGNLTGWRKDFEKSKVEYLMTGEQADRLLRQIPATAETIDDVSLNRFVVELNKTRAKVRQTLNKKGWQDNPILVARYNKLMDIIISLKTERDITSVIIGIQQLNADVENRLSEPKLLEDGTENPDYITLEDVNELKQEISLFSGFIRSARKLIDELEKSEGELSAFRTTVEAANYKLVENEEGIKERTIELLMDLNRKEKIMSEEKFRAYTQQKDISQIDRWMTHLSDIKHPLVKMFKDLLDKVNYNRFDTEAQLRNEIRTVNDSLKKWAKSNGMNIYQAYNKILNDQKNLVSKYSSEYYKEVQDRRDNINDTNKEWFKNNFHRNEYQEKNFQKWKKDKMKELKSYYKDEKVFKKKWEEWLNDNDITYNNGNNNAWFRPTVRISPINEETYYSKEYEYIRQNKPLLDFYEFYREKNAEFNSQVDFTIKNNFVPEIHKDMIDTMLQDGLATTMMGMNVIRSIKESWKYRESDDRIGLTEDDKEVPIMFMDTINPKNKSIDLAQSMYLFGSYVNQYQGLKELEHVAMALKELIANTDVVKMHKGRKVKMEGTQDFATISKDNKNILAFFDNVVNYYVYGEAMSSTKVTSNEISPQLTKVASKLIQLNSKNNIAFNLLSAAGGHLGATAQLHAIAKKGNYFTMKQLYKSRTDLANSQKNIMYALAYFRPGQDDAKHHRAKEINSSTIRNKYTRGGEYWLQQKSDDLIEHSVMGAMLQNYAINPITNKAEPIPSLKKFFKDHPKYGDIEWVSLMDSIKMENGKEPTILNQHTGEHIDAKTFISFRNKVRGVSAKVKGNMSAEDTAAYRTTLLGQLLMQFRGWIPAMLRHRAKEQKYDPTMEEIEVGTWRAAFTMIKAGGLKTGALFLAETLPWVRNRFNFAYDSKIIKEKFATWKDDNPEDFAEFMRNYDLNPNSEEDVAKAEEMMKETFAKEYISGIKSLAKELQLYFGLYLLYLLVMYGVDDETRKDNPAVKGMTNLIERAMLEIGFFIPGLDWATTGNLEMYKMASRSPIPAMDTIKSALNLMSNTVAETSDLVAGVSPFEDKTFQWMKMPDKAFDNPWVMEEKKDKSPVLYYTRNFIPGAKGVTKTLGVFNTTEKPDTVWDWLWSTDDKVYK